MRELYFVLIREPFLIKRWKSGDLTKAKCLSDDKCRGAALSGKGIYCVTKENTEGRR